MELMLGDKVLDIGCRDGTFVLTAARDNPNKQFIGTDIDNANIDMANAKAEELGIKNATFFYDDITDSKLPMKGEFDTVYCMETMEHLLPDTLERAHNNSTAFCKKGGRFVISVPASTHISDPDHKSVFYREIMMRDNPDLKWSDTCPHLWLMFYLDV